MILPHPGPLPLGEGELSPVGLRRRRIIPGSWPLGCYGDCQVSGAFYLFLFLLVASPPGLAATCSVLLQPAIRTRFRCQVTIQSQSEERARPIYKRGFSLADPSPGPGVRRSKKCFYHFEGIFILLVESKFLSCGSAGV